jgi:hypothetical protein
LEESENTLKIEAEISSQTLLLLYCLGTSSGSGVNSELFYLEGGHFESFVGTPMIFLVYFSPSRQMAGRDHFLYILSGSPFPGM